MAGTTSKQSRLERLEQRRNSINQEIARIKAKESAHERKLDTRRKILIGAMILDQMKQKRINVKGWLVPRLKDYLKKEADHKLFDFDDMIKQYEPKKG